MHDAARAKPGRAGIRRRTRPCLETTRFESAHEALDVRVLTGVSQVARDGCVGCHAITRTDEANRGGCRAHLLQPCSDPATNRDGQHIIDMRHQQENIGLRGQLVGDLPGPEVLQLMIGPMANPNLDICSDFLAKEIRESLNLVVRGIALEKRRD